MSAMYISIHALREEGDVQLFVENLLKLLFQSTPSARRATQNSTIPQKALKFQSTPSARRATGYDLSSAIARLISIHALREEGDTAARPQTQEK